MTTTPIIKNSEGQQMSNKLCDNLADRCWHLVNDGPLVDFVNQEILTGISEADFVDALNNVKPSLPDPFKQNARNKFRDILFKDTP